MSSTIQNVYEAREQLLAKYPGRRFTVVDTLSISGPMALLVLKAHELYAQGASELIKYAVIVISSAPMLAVYVFIQKFFVRGVMIGAIKG